MSQYIQKQNKIDMNYWTPSFCVVLQLKNKLLSYSLIFCSGFKPKALAFPF